MKLQFQSPKGVPDILPKQQRYFDHIEKVFSEKAAAFGFEKISLPIFEEIGLYQKGTGISTDIVQKEIYEVTRTNDQNDEKGEKDIRYALRPEFTPGIIRSYVQHGMHTKPQPVKLYTYGPILRHDKPQKGRYRQFNQLNLEVIGNGDSITHALLILMIYQFYQKIKLENSIVIEINNIGCKKCQPKVRKKIISHLENQQDKLCPACQERIYSNPLRILDCKNKQCQKIATSVPHIIDLICTDCKKHFMKTLEFLDELKVPYDLNPFLVRGLDYYNSTIFEIIDKKDKSKKASLGGGGAYNGLTKLYGGPDLPGIGFAAGMERIAEKLQDIDTKIDTISKTDVFIVQLGKKAKKLALNYISELSEKGYRVGCAVGKDTLTSQLKAANKAKSRLAIIIGQREMIDKTLIIKDLEEANQETINMSELENYLSQKIQK